MISNFNMPNPNETKGDKGEETSGLQPTITCPRKRRDPGEESRADSDSDAAQEAKPEFAAEVDVDVEDIYGDSERARREREKMAIEEKIASFFEDRTFFYDVAHEDYKNKTRKDAELAEFAAVIGYDAAAVWKRFTSNRTDYGKLKNRKSWQGAKKLTNLQTFKLTRYKFLDAHITSRSYSEETGKVHIFQASYGVDDYDDLGGDVGGVDDDLARSDPSNEGRKRSSSTESKRSRKKAKEPEVVDLLSQMIEDNRRRNMEAEKKIEAMAAEKLQNERDTWGSWLMSAAQGIPAESWRSFQRDTFEVALRYLPPEGIGAPAPVISAATATYPTPISLHKS